jgi:hypothetical protein
MPVGNDEWKSGIKHATFEQRIIDFLKRDPDNAFSLAEIVAGLGYKIEIGDLGSFVSGVAGYWLFQNAIDNLVKRGLVEGRKIKQSVGEQIYYKIM